MLPKIGQYLFASCSGQDVGQIVATGEDANCVPTIDIVVFDYNEFLSVEEEFSEVGVALTTFDLEESDGPARVILRFVQYKFADDDEITPRLICNTPGDNCFRCSKLFWLRNQPSL